MIPGKIQTRHTKNLMEKRLIIQWNWLLNKIMRKLSNMKVFFKYNFYYSLFYDTSNLTTGRTLDNE